MVEVFINGEQLDLFEGFPIPINMSVADVREPNKRKNTFTKTITVPSSAANNRLFKHIYNVNTSGGFDPSVKAEALVLDGGITQIEGNAQLKAITTTDHFDRAYEIVIFGEVVDIFQSIGESRLNELDLSEYDHELSKTNQINSWGTSIKVNGIDTAFSLGTGYVYPYIDKGNYTNLNEQSVDSLSPAIYFKTIMDKIFESVGKTYTSTFLTSAPFINLIMPHVNSRLELSDAQVSDRLYNAGMTTDLNAGGAAVGVGLSGILTGSIPMDDDSTGANFDNGGNYDTVAYEYTVPDNGYYSFFSKAYAGFDLTPNTGVTVDCDYAGGVVCTTSIKKNGVAIATDAVNCRIDLVDNITGSFSTPDVDTVPSVNFSGGASQTKNLMFPQANNILCAAGDVITIEYEFFAVGVFPNSGASNPLNKFVDSATGTTYYDGDIEFFIRDNSTWYNKVQNKGVPEGGTVEVSQTLPDMLQTEFISNVVKAFNLYIEPDKNTANNYIIEPRDDFQASGNVINWTDLLSHDKEQVLTPLGALNAGRYLYTYKEDRDHFNQLYTNSWGEIYGEEEYDINNDFIKNEVKTELTFAPTPLADDGVSDLVCPRIISTDSNNVAKPYAGLPRMLYYSGLRTLTVGSWNYYSVDEGDTVEYEYPYCGHLDDPFSPSLDLNFGVVNEVYYDDSVQPIVWTDNNLFNVYHKKLIQEITDKDSVIFTGYFNIKTKDIKDLSFTNRFYFLDAYWELHRVIDFNPNGNELTKCEFLKLTNYNPHTETTISVSGGYLTAGQFNPPKTKMSSTFNGNSQNQDNKTVKVNGIDNIVSYKAKFVDILGDGNIIQGASESINLLNSNNNIIADGVSNVTLINTDGATITESGTYVNGVIIKDDPDHHSGYYDLHNSDLECLTVQEYKQMTVWDVINVGAKKLTVEGQLFVK